jgi:hypothetical protein
MRIVTRVVLYAQYPSFYYELPMLKCLGLFRYACLLVPVVMGEIEVVLDSAKISDLCSDHCIIVIDEACHDRNMDFSYQYVMCKN